MDEDDRPPKIKRSIEKKITMESKKRKEREKNANGILLMGKRTERRRERNTKERKRIKGRKRWKGRRKGGGARRVWVGVCVYDPSAHSCVAVRI